MNIKIHTLIAFMCFSNFALSQTAVLREAEKNAERDHMLQTARNYDVVAPGVVLDVTTKLEWMRCSIGQDWIEILQKCEGTPLSLKFNSAENIARQLNAAGGYAGKTDWRLPTKDELESLVVCMRKNDSTVLPNIKCVWTGLPAIAQLTFPQTPAAEFWTSSIPNNKYGKPDSEYLTTIDFKLGMERGGHRHHSLNKNTYLRLVRR